MASTPLWRNMSVRLFVGNLPYNTTEAELREHFSAVGPLTYVHLPTDRESRKPKKRFDVSTISCSRAGPSQLMRRAPETTARGRDRRRGLRSRGLRPCPV